MNITEKILSRAAGKKEIHPGEIIEANIDLAMSHDGTSPPTIKTFHKVAQKVWDPEKIVIVFDHNIPANNIGSAEFQKVAKKFAKEQGIKNLYTHGEGICHQVLPERGYVKPGNVIVGADSHTCTYGAFGAFATGMGATDLAMVYATGKTWFMVPEAYKVTVDGDLGKFVSAKDVVLNVAGEIGSAGATYKSLEFHGETIDSMHPSGRMTICNMAIEMGAKNGIMEPNKKTMEYLKNIGATDFEVVKSDKDSTYQKEYSFDVNDLEPQISCPHDVDNVKGVSKVEGVSIDQALIGSCTNGRLEDLREAAEVLNGKKIHKDVRLLVIPASANIYKQALKEGFIETFIDAGAIVCNPGCGPCLGAHMGVIGSEEVCVSTTNRNFMGRMGDPESYLYLANPAVVAYSAVLGEIANPQDL